MLVTKGIRTTRGSLLYADNVPEEDAPVVERLKEAGAILLGKTNTPELGWKAAPITGSLDRRTIPGGSTGPRAARAAASFFGIFGLKPTYGLVPAYPPSAAEALAAAKRATQRLVDLGAQVEEATPDVGNFAQPWQLLFYGGISGYIAAQPAGWEEKLDPGLAGLVRVAQRATAIDLAQAHQAQARIYGVVRRFFETYDLLVSPSYAMPAWPVGLDSPIELNGRTIGEDGAAELTMLFNLTGQPAATVPCGWTADGLPLGLQIVGRRHDDALVLRAAAAYEAAAPWAGKRPAV